MNVLTFYFSGSGNTEWVVRRWDGMLKGNGHTSRIAAVEAVDMAAFVRDLPGAFDCIGFAYPVYAADIPRSMFGAIRGFAEAASARPDVAKNLFIINTFAYVNALGIFGARKLFRGTPFRVRSLLNVKMINSAPRKKAKDLTGPDEARKRNAQRQLAAFLKRMEHGKNRVEGVGPQLLGGKLVRALLRRPIQNNYRRMRVDPQVCTGCMLCVRECPTHSIRYENPAFTFADTCEACMRCYHHCPVRAITNG